jgi:hypothetical protein
MHKIFMMILLVPLVSAQETADLQPLLRGAQVGMTLQAFNEAHPDVQAKEGAAQAPGLDVKSASVEETFDRDPLFGLACIASYGFTEGELREMVVQWRGERTQVAQLRQTYLQLAVQQEGTGYRRDAVRVNPDGKDAVLAPVLVWEKGGSLVLAMATLDPDGTETPEGTMTYAVFPATDTGMAGILVGKTLSAEALAEVFTGIELQQAPAAVEGGK